MGDQLWKLFEETGDPCVYLLLKKAGEREQEHDAAAKKPQTELQVATPVMF